MFGDFQKLNIEQKALIVPFLLGVFENEFDKNENENESISKKDFTHLVNTVIEHAAKY